MKRNYNLGSRLELFSSLMCKILEGKSIVRLVVILVLTVRTYSWIYSLSGKVLSKWGEREMRPLHPVTFYAQIPTLYRLE